MALGTQTAPQARLTAPLYETDHRPMTAWGYRAADTLPVGEGETIDMLKVPKGARILNCGIIVSKAATTTACNLGAFDTYDQSTYESDADGLMTGANINTATIETASSAPGSACIQLGKELTWDSYIRLAITTGALGNDVDVYVWVTYVMKTDEG